MQEGKFKMQDPSRDVNFRSNFAKDTDYVTQGKTYKSSSFLIKDIVRDEFSPVDHKTEMVQKEAIKRRSANYKSAFGQYKPFVVDELTLPLQTETTDQSRMVLLESEKGSWHVGDEYITQCQQKRNKEVTRQSTNDKRKEDKDMISSFGDRIESRSHQVECSDMNRELFKNDTAGNVRESRKEAEELSAFDLEVANERGLKTKHGFYHDQSLQPESHEYRMRELPPREPVLIKKEQAGTSQNNNELKPQKERYKSSLSEKEVFDHEDSDNGAHDQYMLPQFSGSSGGSNQLKISTEPKKDMEANLTYSVSDPTGLFLGGSNDQSQSPNSNQSKVKSRSSFSVEQIYTLEMTFARQKYLGTKEREQLAQTLGLSDTQVKTWFQNRRMKMKRKHAEATKMSARLTYLNTVAGNVYRPPPCYHGYPLNNVPNPMGPLVPSCLMPSRPLGVALNQVMVTSPQYGCPCIESATLYPSLTQYGRISPPLCMDRTSPPLHPGLSLRYENDVTSTFLNSTVPFSNKQI